MLGQLFYLNHQPDYALNCIEQVKQNYPKWEFYEEEIGFTK